MGETRITEEMISAQSNAKQEYDHAKARSSGITLAKEKFKNLLFNYYEPIVNAVIENRSLHEEVESLNVALQEADDENDALRKKISDSSSEVKKAVSRKTVSEARKG